MSSMYPEINKEQMPSAPPTYSESVGAQKYVIDPQHAGPNIPQGPAPTGPPHVVVVQQPALPPLGPQSVQLSCPVCKALVLTRVDEESSTSAYLCCMLMLIVGCGLCSCIPFCMDNFKKYSHKCPNCNAFIGNYQP